MTRMDEVQELELDKAQYIHRCMFGWTKACEEYLGMVDFYHERICPRFSNHKYYTNDHKMITYICYKHWPFMLAWHYERYGKRYPLV